MTKSTQITADAAASAANLSYDSLPGDALNIARRCMIDGIGQIIAWALTEPVRHIANDVIEQGGRPDALVPGCGDVRAPAALVARVLSVVI